MARIRQTPRVRTRQPLQRYPGPRPYPSRWIGNGRIVLVYGNERTVVEVVYQSYHTNSHGVINVPVAERVVRRGYAVPRDTNDRLPKWVRGETPWTERARQAS